MDEQYQNYIVDCLNYWKEHGPTTADLIWETVVESVAIGLKLEHGDKFDEAVWYACREIRTKYPHDNSKLWQELASETVSGEILSQIKVAFFAVAAPDYSAKTQYDQDKTSIVSQLETLYTHMKKTSNRHVYPGTIFPNENGVYALWRSSMIHTPTYVGEGNLRSRLLSHRIWWGKTDMYVSHQTIPDYRQRLLAERFLIAVWKPGANVK
jgi:hypothetical protein